MSWEDWLSTDPMPTAPDLQYPVLMIHSDGAVLPQYTKHYFERIGSAEKELYWMETDLESPFQQFSYYDQKVEVEETVGRAARGFGEKM
ncbi:MAG: hypothetical protein AAFP19_18825 [Bacteroidota bacterium]